MKNRITKIALPVLACLLTSVASGQENFRLVMKYAKGEVYRYKTESSFESVQEMNGTEYRVTGSNLNRITLAPDSVGPEGDISFIMTYEEMVNRMKTPMFDTVMTMKELVGKRGRIIFSRAGKELRRERIDSATTGKSNKESLFTVNLLNLPDHPVAIGEKWEVPINDSTVIGEGMIRYNGIKSYTLVGREAKNNHACVRIAFTSRKESAGKFQQMGTEMVMEGTEEITGTIWFDDAAGIMVFKETTSTVEMTYATTGQTSMSVPSTQVVRASAVLVE